MYVAMIFGAFSLSRTFFLPYFGGLSDHKGRKPFIVGGLFAYVVIALAFTIFTSLESLIFLRFIHGIASAMIMPVVQAYVGEISPVGKEGMIMGLFNTSMFAGLSLGPLIGGVLKDHLNIEAAFVCMGALALLGFLFSGLYLPPRKAERISSNANRSMTQMFNAMWQMLFDRRFTGLFAFRFAHTACIGVIWGFLPVFANIHFSLSSTAIAVLITLSVLISGVTQIPMGYLADRFNRKLFVIVGGLMVCTAMWSFNWSNGFYSLLWASIGFGIGGGTAMPALMAMGVVYGGRKKAMGSVMAMLTIAHSAGMLVGSLLAGVMMDFFQLRAAFSVGAVVMFLGWVAFILFTPRTDLPDPEPCAQATVEMEP